MEDHIRKELLPALSSPKQVLPTGFTPYHEQKRACYSRYLRSAKGRS
jgi:hypothetical protein